MTAYGEFLRGYRDVRETPASAEGAPYWLGRARLQRVYNAGIDRHMRARVQETFGVSMSKSENNPIEDWVRQPILSEYQRGALAAKGLQLLDDYSGDVARGFRVDYDRPRRAFVYLNKTGNLQSSRVVKRKIGQLGDRNN
ncbi:MAG: hypothetical protein HY517_02460 [Candidatus Aenigmarchaeota archaeon]|nr:hypothetical protein [Candidatus Aenigmarchaeota archaeon]